MGKPADSHRRMPQARKCVWYLLNYDCVEGVWEPADAIGWELLIPSDFGPSTPIANLDVRESRKTLGVIDCPAGGNASHLEHIRKKVGT